MTNLEKISLCQAVVDRVQAEHRRPACRLRISRGDYGVTDSHLGGVPYVPRDGTIPTKEASGQLWLCAQINFAQMPPMEPFPQKGILQIFLPDWDFDGGFGLLGEDSRDQADWRVVYHPEVDETVTLEACRAKMAVPWEAATKEHMPRRPHRFDLEDIAKGRTHLWRAPEVPLRIAFSPVEQEPVTDEDYRFDLLCAQELARRLPGADWEDFAPYRLGSDTPEAQAALRKLWAQIQGGGSKLGGWARYLQGDPREDLPELAAWDTLLLQLDDDPVDFPAGLEDDRDLNLNYGSMNFLIRRKDLARGDFSQVLAQWSCT